ncbi:PHD finger domain-containing protein [Rhodoferax sp. GW822-FHT02A01]|uniref:PHD finger domain-containing protein n=1 Tax=Rhodoferax sp. GW822-FHT02A01 TaxID=3141537 RepID=UPI00315CACF3
MDKVLFAKVAESLRQYRRAELLDFEDDVGEKPVDILYVDPLPDSSVLNSVLSGNTTFVLGRKGTGKSTLFAKAQSILRERDKTLSVYLDVKTLHEVVAAAEQPSFNSLDKGIDPVITRSHLLRKEALGHVISELLKEIGAACERMSIVQRWLGKRRKYEDLKLALQALADRIKKTPLKSDELPILAKIDGNIKRKAAKERGTGINDKVGGVVSDTSISFNAEVASTAFEKSLEDQELYEEYSDVVLKSFPFYEIIRDIRELLEEAQLQRVVIFFDDFSELKLVDQKLFVDVVLSPLNNASNEAIKLKVAGYPGRVYYGRIDPGKVDTITLDFVDLYETTEVQEMERSAIDYTHRLLTARFKAFGVEASDYFEVDSNFAFEQYAELLFQCSFNVPRIVGHLLHYCYLDRISKGQKITAQSIRLASQKYYEQTVSQYFDRMNRFALEPFENKLDRDNQKKLLDFLISETRRIRRGINEGTIGGTYFSSLRNAPTSHFIVDPELEGALASLESNFLLSRYKKIRDKNGQPALVFALFYGLCESERVTWGYPPGREFRNYFVQRCFEFTRALTTFLSTRQTIRCSQCGSSYGLDKKEMFETFKWSCPECRGSGTCKIFSLADDFRKEVAALDTKLMLEPIELRILECLEDESRPMRAGEIAPLIDATHQLVGRRTSKLNEQGLVEKKKDVTGHSISTMTERARATYFPDAVS